jgi:hypothetical protein
MSQAVGEAPHELEQVFFSVFWSTVGGLLRNNALFADFL